MKRIKMPVLNGGDEQNGMVTRLGTTASSITAVVENNTVF